MKRTIAILLALALALALGACGETPPDPGELYAGAEAMLASAASLDYSYESDVSVKIQEQGVTLDMTMDGACKYTGRGGDEPRCSASASVGLYGTEAVSRMYYADGVFYQLSDAGDFKTPMDAGEFFRLLMDEMSISSDARYLTDYTLTENSDDTFSIGFTGSGEDLGELLEQVSGGMGTELDAGQMTCTGSMLVTAEGVPLSSEVHMEVGSAAQDMTMSITADMTMTYNSVNGDVTADVPPAAEYIQVNDLELPGYFASAYSTLDAETALAFENSTTLTLTRGESRDKYSDKLSCAYISGDSLRFRLDDDVSFNDISSVSSETYENGVLSGVYDGEESSSSGFTDGDMAAIIMPMFKSFAPDWEVAESVSMTERDGVVTIEYDYTDDYILAILDSYYVMLTGGEISAAASAVTVDSARAVMTVDAVSGALLTHAVTALASYEVDGAVTDVALDFFQTVTAVGADVRL